MRSGRAGAEALREARNQFERDGVEIKALRRCDPEGRDGTRLPSCFKVYLPYRVGSSAWSSASSATATDSRFAISHSASVTTLATPTPRPSTPSPTGGFMESRNSDFDSYENLVPKLVPDSSELS